MKYFFMKDSKGMRHVVVANDMDEAKAIASQSVLVEFCYEMLPETFNTPGFLISAK